MIDLKRCNLGVKRLVSKIEQAIIDLLADYDIESHRRENAPGVYIKDAKIAALGLRVRRGCSYHGLSLNIDMNLEPFTRINPCGFPNLEAIQLHDIHPDKSIGEAGAELLSHLKSQLRSIK